MLTLSLLRDCPQHLPQVALWIFDEWGYLIPGLTLNKVKNRLQSYLNRETIPLTVVAIQDDLPVGTSSLVFEDMSSRPELSPWLASVYVMPECRKQGIGSQLVRAIEDIGKKLSIPRLYLFTPDQEKFYSRLGWMFFESTEFRGQQVVIMYKSL